MSEKVHIKQPWAFKLIYINQPTCSFQIDSPPLFEHSVTEAMHIKVAKVLLSACLINCILFTGNSKILEYICAFWILDSKFQRKTQL